MEGFEERFGAAMAQGRELFEALNAVQGLRVSPLADGSNIFPLRMGVARADPGGARASACTGQGIFLPPASGTDGRQPAPEVLPLAVNATILRRSNEALRESFAVR